MREPVDARTLKGPLRGRAETTRGRAMRERIARAAVAVGSGLLRSAAFAGTALIIPATIALLPVLAALRLVGRPWSWTNPWSWFALAIITVTVTMALAHPVAVLFRRMLARWAGIRLASGYRKAPEPVRLPTGFWWNGSSYERSRDDAQRDLRMRRALEPAYRREVRWAAVVAITVVPTCGFPLAALIGAAVLFILGTPALIVIGFGLVVMAAAVSPFAWRVVRPLATQWLAAPRLSSPALSAADLRAQRADLTAAHDAEIRRIERDLHDGAQSRLTAVGLDLATARTTYDGRPRAGTRPTARRPARSRPLPERTAEARARRLPARACRGARRTATPVAD